MLSISWALIMNGCAARYCRACVTAIRWLGWGFSWVRECARGWRAAGKALTQSAAAQAGEPPPVSIPSPLQTQVIRVIASMVWNRERKEPS